MIAGELPGGRPQIRDLGWALENSKVELILVSRLTDVAGPRIHLRPVDGLPMVHVDLPQYSGFNHTVKRGIDIVIAATALLMLAPLLVAIGVAVRLEQQGPGAVPPGARRRAGRDVHDAEVPLDGRRRRAAAGRAAIARTRAAGRCSS